MTRPQARRSSLAGLSAVAPANNPSNTTKTSNPGNTSNTGETSKKGVPAVRSSTTEKITVNMAADLACRARGAYRATGHLTGTRSFSQWVADAIQAKLEAEERTYNAGQPFAEVGAGVLPTGAPIRR